MKRFYKTVTLSASDHSPVIYTILLDGKLVKTPERKALEITTRPLADAVISEWEQQDGDIDPTSMPLTQWVGTTIDRVQPHRAQHEQMLQDYLDSDLLLYRVAAEGETVVMGDAQMAKWDPILNWFKTQHNLSLSTTTELAPLAQEPTIHQWLRAFLRELNDFELAVLLVITQQTGSILLGVAFLQNAYSETDVFDAANVEEQVKYAQYHEAIYGSAPDQERRELQLRNDLKSARQYLQLLQQ